MSSSEEIAKAAKLAFEESQLFPSAERVNALHLIRKELDLRKADILAANAEDLKVCLTPTPSRTHAHRHAPRQRSWRSTQAVCRNP